jgi:hypothetical protein
MSPVLIEGPSRRVKRPLVLRATKKDAVRGQSFPVESRSASSRPAGRSGKDRSGAGSFIAAESSRERPHRRASARRNVNRNGDDMTAAARGASVRRLAIVAAMLLALLVAGCGGSSSSSSSSTSAAPASEAAAAGIPQNNEGDHDGDNNGGPSDGDGDL